MNLSIRWNGRKKQSQGTLKKNKNRNNGETQFNITIVYKISDQTEVLQTLCICISV